MYRYFAKKAIQTIFKLLENILVSNDKSKLIADLFSFHVDQHNIYDPHEDNKLA